MEPLHKSSQLTIEEVKALYFDQQAIIETPTPVYRFDHPSAKFYFTYDTQLFKPEFFMAVMSMLDRTAPQPIELKKYYLENGQKAVDHAKERSEYGMLMHITFGEMIIKGSIDIETIDLRVRDHMFTRQLLYDQRKWTEELTKDILSFGQFVIDYDVKPLSIAQLLVSRELGIGGELDFVCEMNDKLYTDKTAQSARKRCRTLIDFKSGKSGFFENNAIQLEAYRRIWNENFPGNEVDSIANWGGKAWIKSPSYAFERHDGKPCLQKLDHYIELGRIDEIAPNSYIRKYKGVVEFGKSPDANYESVQVERIIAEIMTKRI